MLRLIYLVLPLVIGQAVVALAHDPVATFLRINIDGRAIQGTWDLALLDFEAKAQLQSAKAPDEIAMEALRILLVEADGVPCQLLVGSVPINGGKATINFSGECPGEPRVLTVDYRFVLATDRQSHPLVAIHAGYNDYSTSLSSQNPTFVVNLLEADRLYEFRDYLFEGVWHIWTGYDHILFLLSLLFTAPFVIRNGAWTPGKGFRGTLVQTLEIVTAFTIAHSITLGLVIFGLIALPSRVVETSIALSIAIAAGNNLRPVVQRGLWPLTFVFGLIHGMGFAGALRELGLPENARWLALVAFNLGVELGQMTIVALLLPVLFWARSSTSYSTVILRGVSGAILAVATVWFIQRASGVILLKGALGE